MGLGRNNSSSKFLSSYLDIWRREIQRKDGLEQAAELVSKVESRFNELLSRKERLPNRFIRDHLEKGILPVLALYQVLLERDRDQRAALTETGVLAEAAHALMAEPSYWKTHEFIPFFGYLPRGFDLLRKMGPILTRVLMPAPYFEVEPCENDRRCYSFKVHRCFYHDVLSSYGAAELTPVYCNVDDQVFRWLPSSIRWQRPTTLSRGDAYCHFRWKKTFSTKEYPSEIDHRS